MTDYIAELVADRLKSAAWEYIAANWITIVIFLAIAAGLCGIASRLFGRFGLRGVVATFAGLALAGWLLGYHTAPGKEAVQTVVQTVEKTVNADASLLDQLRGRIAALVAERDSSITDANAALATMRGELADARAEIDRLRSVTRMPTMTLRPANGQCPNCNRLINVGNMLSERFRCPLCKTINSARTLIAWREKQAELEAKQRSRGGSRPPVVAGSVRPPEIGGFGIAP